MMDQDPLELIVSHNKKVFVHSIIFAYSTPHDLFHRILILEMVGNCKKTPSRAMHNGVDVGKN